MTIPELTEEQRKANLEKAMKMRKERADIRAKLANGTYTVADGNLTAAIRMKPTGLIA